MHFLFTACLVGERLEAHRPPGGELHLKKSFCSLNGVNDWQLSSARDRAWLHPPFTTMFVFCPRHPVFTRSYLSLKVHRVFYFSGRDRISINRCLCRVGGCRPSVMDLWLGGWIFLGERSMAEQFWYFSFFFFCIVAAAAGCLWRRGLFHCCRARFPMLLHFYQIFQSHYTAQSGPWDLWRVGGAYICALLLREHQQTAYKFVLGHKIKKNWLSCWLWRLQRPVVFLQLQVNIQSDAFEDILLNQALSFPWGWDNCKDF